MLLCLSDKYFFTNLQKRHTRNGFQSALPTRQWLGAHSSGQNARLEVKTCPLFGSYTHLVITAHQHGGLKTSICSNSDFWKCIRSSATLDSPNLCKTHGISKFTPILPLKRFEEEGKSSLSIFFMPICCRFLPFSRTP